MYHYKKFIILVCFISFFNAGNLLTQKLNIDEVVNIAIENNQEIKTAKLKIEREKALKLSSFNIPKPQLFIEYEGIKSSLNNFESRKIGILQELEFPTNYFLRNDIQQSEVDIAKMELNKLAYEVKYEAESAYLSLLLNIKLLDAARDNLKIYNDFLFIAEKKYDAGATSNLEVLGAKVNKIKYENEIKNIESEIIKSKSELKKLMNVSYFSFEPADDLIFRVVQLDKNEILLVALSNNPVLKINKYQKEKFSKKKSLTKSQLLPDLSFKYYSQKIGNDAGFWGVEFGVGVPLWFWWEQSGNIKEADREFDIASSEEINIKKTIENDVNRSVEEFENGLRESLFFHIEAMPETDEILRQAKISYEEGAIDYVEYLQALQIVYETRTQYLKSLFNYYASIFKLEKLIGGEIK